MWSILPKTLSNTLDNAVDNTAYDAVYNAVDIEVVNTVDNANKQC